MMLKTFDLNPVAMLRYAETWAYGRNPAYADFDSMGGDCTNFVSQCIFAGGAPMNVTKDVGWYYVSLSDRAAAWTGVEFLYRFLTTNRGVGPFGHEIPLSDVRVGDVIQLGDGAGFYHTLLTVDVVDGTPYVAAHTFDAFDRPLWSYSFDRLRALSVRQGRVWVPDGEG